VLSKDDLLRPLAARRRNEVVVTTMGVVRPWGRYSSHPLDFASADSAMAHAADFALGIALAQPERRVWCLNGDGSMLMSLGTLVTIVESGATNLVLFVLQNDAYEVTGNQKVPGAGHVDFAAMARAAGFKHVHTFDDPKLYAAAIPQILAGPGPLCVVVKIAPGVEGPLARQPAEEAVYLRTSLAESARTVRRALLEGR
jgi:sulfopyruvate decarboxylase subunit beta